MIVEIYNSAKPRPIYTTELKVREKSGRWRAYRKNTLLSESPLKAEALTIACERILSGFKQPGIYTAFVNGEPFAFHEPREVEWPESTS